MSKPVLTLEAFAEFCESKGDQEFDYEDVTYCACGQYAQHLGVRTWFSLVNSKFWNDANDCARRVAKNPLYVSLVTGELYHMAKFSDLAAYIRKRL